MFTVASKIFRSQLIGLASLPMQCSSLGSTACSRIKKIDHSLVPTLCENDLEETFVRGSGPGGQAVNKTSNCVVLRHKPTGIIVKCHKHRMLYANRRDARTILITRLDELYNKEHSVENQVKAIQHKKNSDTTRKRNKLNEMKKQWKERENIE